MPTPSIKQMLIEYRRNQFTGDISGMWGAVLFFRLPGFLLARMAIALGVSATTLTLTGMAVTLAIAIVAIALPASTALLLVGLLSAVFQIFDCADGTVARANGTESRNGQYLDFASDVLWRAVTLAAIGHIADKLFPESAPLYLALGLISAYCATYANLLRRYQAALLANVTQNANSALPPSVLKKGVKILYSFFSGLDEIVPLIAVLAWIGDWLGPFLIFVVGYHATDVLISGVGSFLKLHTVDREHGKQ